MRLFFILFGLLMVGVIILVGVGAFFGFRSAQENGSFLPIEATKQLVEQKITKTTKLPTCERNDQFFTHSPLNTGDYHGLVPLGNLSPPSHTFPTDHVYFHLPRLSDEGGTETVPVYSPGDITITSIRSTEHVEEQFIDYTVDFQPCEEVRGFFIHVTSLSPSIQQAFDDAQSRCNENATGGRTYRSCEAGVFVEVAAGEEIGTAGGGLSAALDLGLLDERKAAHEYANPSRWKSNKPQYVQCPFEYFSDEIQDEFLDRLSSEDGLRQATIDPACGEIAQDVPGTAMGAWFEKGTRQTYPEDQHLALVHDNVDGLKQVFSLGLAAESLGIPSQTYLFTKSEEDVNRSFDTVRPDGVYCYETEGKFGDQTPFTLLIRMPGEGELQLGRGSEASCGEAPWEFPQDWASYER